MLDKKKMREEARRHMNELGILTIQNIGQQVESLSGGQRQGVAVARAAAFARHVVIMDEPTAALGVKESAKVLELIQRVRGNGLPVILISHNMPHVFEVADRIHIQRLGRRVAVITPKSHTMNEAVAIMTGATEPGAAGYDQVVQAAEGKHDAAADGQGAEGAPRSERHRARRTVRRAHAHRVRSRRCSPSRLRAGRRCATWRRWPG